jgi:transcription elongation GreA/GreB family factor
MPRISRCLLFPQIFELDVARSIDERRKIVSQAISRAYTVSVYPAEIGTDHANQDVRKYVEKLAGHPHKDHTVAEVGALALFRAATLPGDDALGTTLADLIDGGISLDRQAAAHRGLDAIMTRHRAKRAKENPLPSDLRAKARAEAPTVIRRGGASAVKPPSPPPRVVTVQSGCRVQYRRLDDETDHDVVIGVNASGHPKEARVVPAGSPLARALIGATKGTVVQVTLGGEPVDLEVVEVTP